MKKLFTGCLVVGLFIIIAGVAAGGYFGVIPGVSTLFGANKPKNLGIAITTEDSVKAQEKTKVLVESLPAGTAPEKGFVLQGKQQVSISLDSTELTGLLNNRKWKYYPIKEVQVKIHDDGTVEASGVLVVDKIMGYVSAIGYNPADVQAVMEKYKIPLQTMPFYLQGTGSVTNGSVNISVANAQAGRIPVPAGIIKEVTPQVNSLVEDVVRKLPGVSVESLSFTGGKVQFIGTVPEKELVVSE